MNSPPEGKILNPKTRRYVNINGVLGKKILKEQNHNSSKSKEDKSKHELVSDDLNNQIEHLMKTKEYKVIGQGTQGSVVLLKINEKPYALKIFKKSKSLKKVFKEAELQYLVSKKNITANIYTVVDKSPPAILMDGMQKTLRDIVKEQDYSLTDEQQKQLLHIYKTLDEMKILHNDPRSENIMSDKDGNLKIIDFGMAKKMNKKTHSNMYSLKRLIGETSLISLRLKTKPKIILNAFKIDI